ncbi:MAG TPA: L-lactate permease [Methanocella sp.]|uniref:L-lactate permease n=1 Tax=Methanocella sp. TaxID=2052833 RepID=UPI002C5016DC|nr:L-lactate permease [Methanocella sp.]HTY92093.1 L-lactate permease [Methanocella sp.]
MDLIGLGLSILPLIVVFLGIVWLKKSGAIMVIVGLVLTALICWAYFKTDPTIIVGGTLYGIVKSFGISVAVVFAMFMVFLMQITGALGRISDAVHNIAGTKEEKALFVGMGFGSFVTALGLVAPTLFPPLLVAMGFSPLAAIAIACLGYDPLCSFALLSLPITAPVGAANSMGIPITVQSFAMNIAIFLPVISVGFAFAILYVVGKMEAVKRSWLPALLSGLVISLSAIALIYWNLVPISIVGVIAGALSMASLFTYNTLKAAQAGKAGSTLPMTAAKVAGLWVVILAVLAVLAVSYSIKFSLAPGLLTLLLMTPVIVLAIAVLAVRIYRALTAPKPAKIATDGGMGTKSVPITSLLKSLSPWLILIYLVSIVGVPQIAAYLNALPGSLEVWTFFANQSIDLNFLSQAYTWIFVAAIIGIFTLDAKGGQVVKALDMTVRRLWGPFLTYSLFFSVAYLMYFSGGVIAHSMVNGVDTAKLVLPDLVKSPDANMDALIGLALAGLFGAYYGLVAPIPGFIGAVIGGSETSSNVMFAKIQNVAVTNTIGAAKYPLAFGSLAVAGGIASAITPAKITNACATLGESGEMESKAMATNMWVAIALTAITCVMTLLFLKIGIGF